MTRLATDIGSRAGPGGNDPRVGVTGALRGSWYLLVVGLVVGVLGAIGVGLVFLGPLIITHRQDLPLEQAYAHYAIGLAARLNAGSAHNPVGNSFRAAETGRNAYTGSCAECHGANGDGKGVFGQQTYPTATALTSPDAKEKTDAELFWITKNGLSFTGMPGFGNQYDDSQIWALVSYIRALQSGQGQPADVPAPTMGQLAMANPAGDAVQRGAAVYFQAGCQECHGAIGNAPGELALRGGGREVTRAIRDGRRGMPSYDPTQISDAQLADLEAYMNTFAGQRQGLAPDEFRRAPDNG